MKQHISHKLLGWFAAASAFLMPSACADDTFKDYFNDDLSDEMKVTFTIAPEAAGVSTRVDGNVTYSETPHISDGSQIDMLVYAVYEYELDSEGNDLLTDELVEFEPKNDFKDIDESIKPGPGQSIIKVKKFPYTMNITLKKGKKYRIAFWAQNSKCHAYKISDLRKVEVHYSELDEGFEEGDSNEKISTSTPNNDERRDAFCRSVIIDANTSAQQHNIFLYRPLAQINVGTNGYDFEIINRKRPDGEKYIYSRIQINRVARYLNVVKDKTYSTTTGDNPYTEKPNLKTPESFAVVDFGYAPIPAYVNYDEIITPGSNLYDQIPFYPTYSKWDWEYTKGEGGKSHFVLKRDNYSIGDYETTQSNQINYHDIYDKEEFLYVHNGGFMLDENKKGSTRKEFSEDKYPYAPYANYNNYNDYESETFKYLSMCYVLTSSTKDEPIVLNQVKFFMAKTKEGKDEYEVFTLNNVPAQRNWRTNIVGNLLSVEKAFEIKLDTDFGGQYSGWNTGSAWEWSGPLANGVYYDAEKDEIQLSSKEGLIWFQKMVNGTLKMREGEGVTKGKLDSDYLYYEVSESGKINSARLSYIGIEEPNDSKLRDRILRATHQLYNQNYNENKPWPEFGFHFVGDLEKCKAAGLERAEAKIKLMADIDLAGEEWIPIGFDGRGGEQMGFKVDEASDIEPSNRVFYGIFDGNGHAIYNLKTKRFSADVHEVSHQKSNYTYKNLRKFEKLRDQEKVGTHSASTNRHPMDNPQWFGRGFFGQIGGNAEIKDLTLNNVDILGCNGVGGIVGIAYGDAIKITGCTVDGGSIIATPMYRGDNYEKNATDAHTKGSRTFARGVYLGGIVGYFNTNEGIVDDCIVRNATLQGVRRVGGLIGSINQVKMGDKDYKDTSKDVEDEGAWMVTQDNQRPSRPKSISNNRIQNTYLIASSYSTYGLTPYPFPGVTKPSTSNSNIYNQIGFGNNTGNLSPYAQQIVGGSALNEISRDDLGEFLNNSTAGLTYAAFPIDANSGTRISTIGDTPLNYLPMLSSWYADKIDLCANYTGEPSAHTRVQMSLFQVFTYNEKQTGWLDDNTFDRDHGFLSNEGNTFYFPMQAPHLTDINYIETSGKAGVFVESVELDGIKGPGNRSVITSFHVDEEGSCGMYVAARSRMQFYNRQNPDGHYYFMSPTIIKNIVVRGEPYAYTGILCAPNVNMEKVYLYNVAIYDCYKTIALDDWSKITDQSMWPNQNNSSANGRKAFQPLNLKESSDYQATPLELENCNLRGYTVPGKNWRSVTYINTTFGQGAYIKKEFGNNIELAKQAYTCKVETETLFDKCYFKAPYIIDWKDMDPKVPKYSDSNGTIVGYNTITFRNGCAATALTTRNIELYTKGQTPITSNARQIPENCVKIIVDSDEQGNPTVAFYDKYNNKIDIN